jgi:hypothetical protein
MGLGTKNRQKQTANICKQHLREKYRNQRGLVEEFILEFEGAGKNCDVTRWDWFTDIKDIKKEMLKRLEAHFGATQGTLRYDPISTNGPESIATFPRENTRIGAADMPCHGPTSWIYSPRDFPK